MPAHGEQYASIGNPFVPPPQRMSEYTAQEIIDLQSKLDRQLGPQYISTRAGPGKSSLHYISGEKIINLANEVFGFNGWSSSIVNVSIDYIDEAPQGRFSMGCTIICRVTLKDGTYHEDIGYGEIKNSPSKGAAFEKIKKEAATDALKRCMRNFGNLLGNCIYDKDFVSKVKRLKAEPAPAFDPDKLHRPGGHPIVKSEPQSNPPMSAPLTSEKLVSRVSSAHSIPSVGQAEDYGDEFDDDDINMDEMEFLENKANNDPMARTTSDANVVSRHPTNKQVAGQPESISRMNSVPQLRPPPTTVPIVNPAQGPRQHSQTPAQQQQPRPPQFQPNQPYPSRSNSQTRPNPLPAHTTGQQVAGGPSPYPVHNRSASNPQTPQNAAQMSKRTPNSLDRPPQPPVQPVSAQFKPKEPPIGFYNARAADLLKDEKPPPNAEITAFNPHTPGQMRRTSGIDHNRSGPIKRESIAAVAGGSKTGQNSGNMPLQRPNFVNPQADINRRIGMPGGGAPSPLGNRTSAYKPPGPALGKRGTDNGPRSVLADVSNFPAELAPKKGRTESPQAEVKPGVST